MFDKKDNHQQFHIWIIVLLVANLLLLLFGFFQEDGATRLEKLKAGGTENYNKIVEIYSSDTYIQQQTQSIDMLLEQMRAEVGPGTTPTENNPQAGNPIQGEDSSMLASIQNILSDAHIQGNPNARYTLIEYSDIECPFCKRHYQNNTIKDLVAMYPDDINYTFRHFPLSNIHPNAQMASEGLECIAELQGLEAFYEMIGELFNLASITRTSVSNVATRLGANQTAFENCLDSGKYSTKVLSQLNEGQNLFGIRGTPGNVIVDTQNGRFIAIPGAFPLENFVQELENLIANQ